MTSTKAIQIGKDLDNARCHGNWTAVPELARRFKKYNSEGAILEQTVLAEMNLIQLINSTRTRTPYYHEDTPYHITLEERIDPNAIKPIQSQLLSTIQLTTTTTDTTTQKELAKIVLARTFFESGDYNKTIEIISELSFEKDQVSQGYASILFLQARSMKAMSLDLLGNEKEAIQTYEGVVSLLSNESTNIKSKSLVEWSEDTLYRAILLSLREGSSVSVSSVLEFMRQYQKVTSNQTVRWRIQKRIIITRQSLTYCSNTYRNGAYCLPLGTSDEKDPALEQQFFIVEQSQLHTIYEKMLHTESPLPKAGQVNTRLLDFVNQFAHDFELIGTTAYDLRGFIEVLDRASQKTFNSPLITRHLFLALVRLGEFDEAEHALHAYLYLVGLVSHGWKETRRDGRALATGKSGLNIAVPDIHPDIEPDEMEPADEMADFKSTEKEDVIDTLTVIVTAIKMYSDDLRRGVDAAEMADLAKQLYQQQSKHDQTARLLEIGTEVYRAVGIAFGLLGCQTFDPELRPQYHEKALFYLQRALEMDPDSWKTYYQMALQQAEMRNIGQAVQSITQAIQRNPRHISLWHLLTLLITCPAQGGFTQALKTCDMGIQQAQQQDVSSDGVDGLLLSNDEYEKASQQLIYHITRTLLLFTIYGPDIALTSSETLFAAFRRIAIPELSTSHAGSSGAHDGMIISGSLGNLMEINGQRGRGRSASSSIVGANGGPPPQISTSTTHIGSKSHDNMLNTKALATGRARSSSNVNASQLLTVPGEEPKQHHHHLHGLHLFGSKSSGSQHSGAKNDQQVYVKTDPVANYSIQSMPISPNVEGLNNNSVLSFQSLAPSILSNTTQGSSILQPNHIPTKPSTRTLLRRATSDQVLSDLWALTAQMFIKSNKLEEARKAVEEAENVDWTSNPQVWCVLGLLLKKEGGRETEAQAAFQKALVIDPNDVRAQLELAKLYIQQNNIELAEGILSSLTKSNGWDCAEAWLHLGEIYRDTGRMERTKACLFYALELESTTPIQPFSILPRYI